MPFLLRPQGVQLHYLVYGTGPRPLLLTHGYSSTLAMWEPQIKSLSQIPYTLIVWSMRGHGDSSSPSDPALYSEEHTVADMLALLNHICPRRRAFIGGLSLGGYMSLAFYRVHPERVSGLLIIDTGPGFKKDSARDAWNKTALATGARFEKEGLQILQQASSERNSVSHRNVKGLVLAARGMLTQRDSNVMDALPQITVPSLVVVGSEDKPFLAASEYMAKKIPNARKVIIPDAGHGVNIDQPAAFSRAVLKWLNEVRAAKPHL